MKLKDMCTSPIMQNIKIIFTLCLMLFISNTSFGQDNNILQRLNQDTLPKNSIWLESLDLWKIYRQNGKSPSVAKSIVGSSISIDGVKYPHGIGLSGTAYLRFKLNKSCRKFISDVNIDDSKLWGSFTVQVFVDGKSFPAFRVKANTKDKPVKIYRIEADLDDANDLIIAITMDRSYNYDLAGARFIMKDGSKEKPTVVLMDDQLENTSSETGTTVFLNKIDNNFISSGDGKKPGIDCTPNNEAIKVNNKIYSNGICVYPRSRIFIDLKKEALQFNSIIAVQDLCINGAIFKIYLDKQEVFNSGLILPNDNPKEINLNLEGMSEMSLIVDEQSNSNNNLPVAIWLFPKIIMKRDSKVKAEAKFCDQVDMKIANIKDGIKPSIHGPIIFGSSPNKPFFYSLPITGEKPYTVSIENLPKGLKYDKSNGIISGILKDTLISNILVKVSNRYGECKKQLTIICGPYAMSVVPPMGWNHWNQYWMNIDEKKVRNTVDAFISLGFANHGYKYVNIDEGWEGTRDSTGVLSQDKSRFGDMKALGDYIHSKGLKFGIYSSPGPLCCGKKPGSMNFEQIDANTWASWGVDYLKYDGCSAGGFPDLKERWKLMRDCLDNTGRDIFYSTNSSQGDPYSRAQLWRTTGDIGPNWQSMSEIGFIKQIGKEKLSGPARFNDPDMLVVGSRLSKNENITHVTLWSMLAAPLIMGYDLSTTDDFLYSLLCNDDVLAIDQDPLVIQGECIKKNLPEGINDGVTEIWTRKLFDGTHAVAFFNRGIEPSKVKISWSELGLTKIQNVRDCWLQTDLGEFKDEIETIVQAHAAVLYKVGKPKVDYFKPLSVREYLK